MTLLFSFITGTIGRYLLIGVVAVGFLAWIRYDAAAPYRAETAALREGLARRIAIEQADAARARAAEEEAARLAGQLEQIVNEANQDNGACRFTELERKRLLTLATGNK